MKALFSVVVLLVCLPLVARPAAAEFIYDAGTGVLTDTDAQQMWVLHGIGFGSSYLFPGFANTWVDGLNAQAVGGSSNWRLPTVEAPANGSAPVPLSGDLGQLFANLSSSLDRSEWPFGLGSYDYGGNIIYTDASVPGTVNFWGLSFGDGTYRQVYPGNAYAYVGVLGVSQVPEPASWIMLIIGLGLFGLRFRH